MADNPLASTIQLSRRSFVAGAAAASVCLTCAGELVLANTLAEPLDAGEAKLFKAGINDQFIKSHKIAVVRKDDVIFAQSALCTHKGCTLKAAGEQLRCPCHGSKFDAEGKPTAGPAKEALCRYGVSLKDDHLIVDLDAIILPGDFEKPGAFVKVPG